MSEKKEAAVTTSSMPRSSGVMKGTATYTRFRVECKHPDEMFQKYMARVRTRAFRPLTAEDEDDASVGWVPVERPFDDEVAFRTDGVFFGSYMNLGLRIDVWRFPTTLVKAKMLVAEREWKNKTGKTRMSRVEKVELRDLVLRKLRRDGVPTSKAFDFSWNLDNGELRFFGKSKNALEHFYELFEKTFGARLVPMAAYTIGMELHLSSEEKANLTTVLPYPLHHRGAS